MERQPLNVKAHVDLWQGRPFAVGDNLSPPSASDCHKVRHPEALRSEAEYRATGKMVLEIGQLLPVENVFAPMIDILSTGIAPALPDLIPRLLQEPSGWWCSPTTPGPQ